MEKSGSFVSGPYRCIFFIVWQMICELGQNRKLCPHSNIICQMIFFLNFIYFYILHNVWYKISTIFVMLKMFSCADEFSSHHVEASVDAKLDFYVVLNILQKITMVCIATVTGICAGSQGNVRERSRIFFCQPRCNPELCIYICFGMIHVTCVIESMPLWAESSKYSPLIIQESSGVLSFDNTEIFWW